MPSQSRHIVAAGHICLDLIPEITARKSALGELLVPGKLLVVGPPTIATGGSVANTGIALHKLGYPVRLMGKVGADPFGQVILGLLRNRGEGLADGMVIDPSSNTSYTAVISPPGIDRVFLHHPGANDTFGVEDLRADALEGAAIFHFGYPPLMRRLYSDNGESLRQVMAKARGAVRSLDLAMPDPDSPAGRADWRGILRQALPEVDLFMPSFEELCHMLGEDPGARSLKAARGLADWALAAGCGVAAIKMGDCGLYVRSSGSPERLQVFESACGCRLTDWCDREVFSSCFSVEVVGTTGSGDTTIAGFLAEVFDGGSPERAATLATAVGACACEAPDATGGVRHRDVTRARIDGGWQKRAFPFTGESGWTSSSGPGGWIGPLDRARQRKENVR